MIDCKCSISVFVPYHQKRKGGNKIEHNSTKRNQKKTQKTQWYQPETWKRFAIY